jgi:hypothetical protein
MRTTIKAIEPKTYQGKVSGYSITLENGVTGYLDDKASSSDLKVGESVEYSVAVKKNKQGKDYNLLTLNRLAPSAPQENVPQNEPTPPAKGTGLYPNVPHAKVDIAEWKFQSLMQLCKLTHELIFSGKFSDTEAITHIEAWTTEMDSLIDGIFS